MNCIYYIESPCPIVQFSGDYLAYLFFGDEISQREFGEKRAVLYAEDVINNFGYVSWINWDSGPTVYPLSHLSRTGIREH